MDMKKTIILFSLILFLGCIDTPKSDIYYFKDINQTGGNDTNKVAVSATDTTAGFLASKLAAGSNITLTTLNPGGNEQVQISASGGGGDSNASLDTRYVQKNPTSTQTIATYGLAIPFDSNIYNANAKLEIKQRVTAGSQFYASLEENQNGLPISVQHGLGILTDDYTETPILIVGNNDQNEGFEFDYEYSLGHIDQFFLSPVSDPRHTWDMAHTIDVNSPTAFKVDNVTGNRVFEVDTNRQTAWFKRLSVDDANISCEDLNDNCINKARGDGNYVQKFPTGNQTIASNNLILTSGHYETTNGGWRYGGDTGYGLDFPIPANCAYVFSAQGLPNSGTAFCAPTGGVEQHFLGDPIHSDFMLAPTQGGEWHKPVTTLFTPAAQYQGGSKATKTNPDGNYTYTYINSLIGWKQEGTWISAFNSGHERHQNIDINGSLDVNGLADFNKTANFDVNVNTFDLNVSHRSNTERLSVQKDSNFFGNIKVDGFIYYDFRDEDYSATATLDTCVQNTTGRDMVVYGNIESYTLTTAELAYVEINVDGGACTNIIEEVGTKLTGGSAKLDSTFSIPFSFVVPDGNYFQLTTKTSGNGTVSLPYIRRYWP